MIQLAIIDSCEEDRNRTVSFFETQKDIRVSAVGANAYDAIVLASRKPEILIMDLEDKEIIDEPSVLPIIRRRSPNTSIIIYTHAEDEEHIFRSFSGGIYGYLLKCGNLDELASAVRNIHAGDYFFCYRIMAKLLHIVPQLVWPRKSRGGPLGEYETVLPSSLSRSELRIMFYLGQNNSNREIASYMNMTEGTIRNKISSALQKTGLRTRGELAVFALKSGINCPGRNRHDNNHGGSTGPDMRRFPF
ncbi:MAG: response regulator transcription factor [Treponema sp.]|jgi:DNA-binding NarL/FixJ family response regulator|nr:response regulator transcription factor [Treponema sp.]